MTVHHRLVPEFILEQYTAGELSGRFPAVVLFVDTSGFTPLTAQLQTHATAGAEVLANVLLAVFEPLIGAVYAHGGFVAGFAGDAFKAIFPTTEPQSYLAALATVHDIRDQMAAQAVQHTPFGNFPFAVRTSIASGEVEWVIWRAAAGDTAHSQQALYTFGGQALDAAVYGESLARAGDLIVTEAARLVLAQLEQFTAEPLVEATAYARVTNMGIWSAPSPPAAESTPAAVDTSSLFYPRDLITQSSQGEFRRVLTLFINLQTLPTAEEGTRFTTTFFSLLERYGGYVCRLGRIGALDAGGTLLLFWGAPTSHENDVERVLNFILDLQARTDIPLRAGISYQIAYAGFVGSPLREEYTCYGLSVNLAARLMTSAPWGSIWVDEALATRGRKLFRLAQIGQQLFKGFSEPLPVHQLRRRRAMLSTLFFKDQLVGRQRELLQLAAMLAPVQNGRFGGVITISGEAGIGKSHLIHECLNRIDFIGRGELFLCQCDEILRESLNPFRYFVHHHFAQRATLTEAQNKARFDTILNTLIAEMKEEPLLQAELERTRSFLGALIGLHWDDSLYAQSEPKLRQENTFIALKSLIKAESLRQPVVLQLEDVHWLDENSRQFLLELSRNVSAFPFIVLITTRDPQWTPSLPDGVSARNIHLQALEASSVTNLAQTLLQGPVSPHLGKLIIERTDGNPFFVEQFVIYLREQQLLRSGERGLRPVAAVSTLPTDLQAILVARIDQLTQQVRHVVQTAAVLGREFDVQILSQMLQYEEALAEKIKAAESFAIWSALSELHYLFKHALLRDAAYNMQLQAQRRQLHETAAQAITTLYAADLSPYYADLAHHYQQAQDTDNERQFATLAGHRAAEKFDNEQALAFFDRALALTADDDLEQRYVLLLAREALYDVLGLREQQADCLAVLQDIGQRLGEPERQAAVWLRAAAYKEALSRFDEAGQAAAEAIVLSAPESTYRAQAHLQRGLALTRVGELQKAQEQLQLALDTAQLAQAADVEAVSLRYYGISEYSLGRYASAAAYFRRSHALMTQLNDLNGQASALNNLGAVHARMGERDSSITYFQQALETRRQIGARRAEGTTLLNLGSLSVDRGDYIEGRNYLQQAQRIKEEIGDLRVLSDVHHNLGVIFQNLGAYKLALTRFQTALELRRKVNDHSGYANSLVNIGRYHIQQGGWAEGFRQLEESLVISQERGDKRCEALVLRTMGRSLMERADLDSARQRYLESLAVQETVNEPYNLMNTKAGLIEVALLQNDDETVEQHLADVMAFVDTHQLAAVGSPFRFTLICYQALRYLNDVRAGSVLQAGYDLLQERAAQIPEEELRRSFLENVVENQRLRVLYEEYIASKRRL